MQPKKTKYRKYYKPRQLPKASNKIYKLQPNSFLTLIATESAYLNSKQIEAARQSIRRSIKRKGRLKIHLFTDIGISNKSSASRMGKGKGKVNYWVGKLSAGQTLFELTGIPLKEGALALKRGANKLPLKLQVYEQ